MVRKTLYAVVLIVLSLFSVSEIVSVASHPELKLSIDYDFFDGIKEYVVKPAIKAFILNKPINTTFRFNNSAWIYAYDANFSNPSIIQLDINWPSTHFLTPGPNNASIIEISGLNVTLSLNYSITATSIITYSSTGICNVSITNVNTNITVGTVLNSEGTNYYISIPQATFDFGKISVDFDSTVASVIATVATYILNNLSKGTITSAVTGFLTNDLSNKLKNATINGINIPYSIFNITATIPEQPIIYNDTDRNYTNIGVLLNITNNQTGEQAPAFFEEVIPDNRVEGQQLQFLLASNVLNQIGWVVQQAGMIKVSLSNKDLPADAPLSLNTTALRILLPELAAKFGAGKGVYVSVKSANQAPQFYARDGRLIGLVATNIEFWVDTNGTRYPDEGLENCTTCSLGIAFNNTLLLELNLFKIDSANVGLTVLNVDMTDLNVISGEGFDPTKLRVSMNNILNGLIPGINVKLKAGIRIPIIGLLGIQDVTLNVNKNYVCLEVSLKKPTNKRLRI